MKKILGFILICFVTITLTGCGAKTTAEEFSGKVTDLSKLYLSKGYIFNIYRSITSLGDDEESYGKGYVSMVFDVMSEFTSVANYNPNADYNIKKVTVTNVKVLSTSKIGIVEDIQIMERYSQYFSDAHVDVTGTKAKYEIVNDVPNSTGVQSRIMLELNKIALYDSTKNKTLVEPTMSQIYADLGITRDSVAIKLGFRIELTTVSNKILYKDYEIVIPPVGVDITSSEFHYDYYETDVSKMEPFLEKD